MASTEQTTFASDEHKEFYFFQMGQYADSRKGLIFPLPASSTFGDFAFDSDHTWSERQVTTWREQSRAPKKLSQLRRQTTLITLVYISSRLRRWPNGDVIITRASFERLEATPTATAIIMLLTEEYCALIPRGAVEFNEAKKAVYRDVRFRDEEAPTFGDCLKVGFTVVRADGGVEMPGQVQLHAHKAGDISDAHPGA